MGQLVIRASGQTLVLAGATNPAGATVGVFSDSGFSSAVTLPATISADTTYWLRDGDTTVTVQQPDGSTLYSGPVSIRTGWPAEINPSPTSPQVWADVAGLSGTYARTADPLWQWRQKLATSASTAVIVGSGDSTMDEASQAAAFYGRLRNEHTLTGEALDGMTADTSHIVPLGYNGMSLATWLADSTKLAALVAAAPDLVVASWGINDVRLGAITQATMRARLVSFITAVRAALPNVSIALRVPCAFTTTNTGAANYIQGPPGDGSNINPAGAAQSYSTMLRNAYLSLIGAYPYVAVIDVQGDVTGTVSRSSHPLMSDQIHPSPASSTIGTIPYGGGQVACADAVAKAIGPSAGFPAVGDVRGGFAGGSVGDYRTVKAFTVVSSGNGFIDLGAAVNNGEAGAQFPLTTADLLFVEGLAGPVSLASGVTIVRPQAGTSIRLLITGDYTAYAGRRAWVASSHPDSTTGDRQIVSVDLASIAAGATATATATVTGARTGGLHDATSVMACPPAGFSGSGLLLLNCYPTANDTVTLIVNNPTGGAIDRAAENWAFWVIR